MAEVQASASATNWEIIPGFTDFDRAEALMEAHVADMIADLAPERVLLLEHPALLTAGSSAKAEDLTDPNRFPVHSTQRGGQYTYHGPGQRVVYPMLDLNARGRDVRAYVSNLQSWIIQTLQEFGIQANTAPDRVGVWVKRPEKPPLPDGSPREDKIAAIGVRVRKWVAFHGLSINVDPDLSHYDAIVPCGISGHGVTSLVDLGLPVTMQDLDNALARNFEQVFGSRLVPHP